MARRFRAKLNREITCGGCRAAHYEKLKTNPKAVFRPPCHAAAHICWSSELMTSDLDAFMDFYQLLRADTLIPVREMILKRGKATEQDLEVIMILDSVLRKWEKEQAAK